MRLSYYKNPNLKNSTFIAYFNLSEMKIISFHFIFI
jgi:hypothetical protein